jgi:hypothetical protein
MRINDTLRHIKSKKSKKKENRVQTTQNITLDMYKGGKEKKSLKEGQQQLYIVSWLKSDKKPNQTDQQIQWLPLSTAARPSPAHHSFFFL